MLKLAASKLGHLPRVRPYFIQEGGVGLAASLTQFKRLRRLSLDHNRLNDGAVRALEQALVTLPLHCRYLAVTLPLDQRYITVPLP